MKSTSRLTPRKRPTFATPAQGELFASVLSHYLATDGSSNNHLYQSLVEAGKISASELNSKTPVGASGQAYSLTKRAVRWHQQSLRQLGILERVPGLRAHWRATAKAKDELTPAQPKVVMLGFSTDLGVAIWGASNDVFDHLGESIAVCITSPPYALRQARKYGNPDQYNWVDFVCRTLEPIVKNLARGGTIAVNCSNDIFEPGLPSRSTYKEEFVLAMVRRFNLKIMDTLIWQNPTRPPAPVQWASKRRMQLNCGYEPVLLFTNDPLASFASNQRVLQPHTESHRRLIAAGGEQRTSSHSDGAYRIRPGSYGNPTAGRIPRNVLCIPHGCADMRRTKKEAMAEGLPAHGAPMPLALAKFLVEYLSRPGDLVVDSMAGWFTTAKAAEMTGRRWISSELMLEHVLAGALRFKDRPGFEC